MPDSTIPKFLIDRAKTILKDMGVPEHLQGFTFLAEAAALKSLFTSNRYMQIYTHIAKAHNISSKTVAIIKERIVNELKKLVMRWQYQNTK